MLAWFKTRDGAEQLINIRGDGPPPLEVRLPLAPAMPTRFVPAASSAANKALFEEARTRCYRYVRCLPDGTLLYEEESVE